MKRVKICFWGVRGSTPAPSKRTTKYGGNTPCVEIFLGGNRIICDAGTGIMPLGFKMAKSGKVLKASILLSHVHWDHISGLSFFEPFFNSKNSFEIIGPGVKEMGIRKALSGAISPPFFPVTLSDLSASIRFRTVSKRPFYIGKVRTVPHSLHHPGGVMGWRFEFPGGKSLVYVSDNEPGRGEKGFVEWAKGVDMMIHDAQYTPAEYRKKVGWGHSPYTYPIKIAKAAGVKRLILSHFNPPYADSALDDISRKAAGLARKNGLKCRLAREGEIFYL